MYSLFLEFRFALRMLLKAPAYSVTVLALLALGIGATTSVYSVVSALLLRGLPYVESARLINIWETDPPMMHGTVSAPNYLDWKTQNASFESMAAFSYGESSLTGDGAGERVWSLLVSAEFFPLLGVGPALGRSFTAEETQPGNDRVVILSHELWQRRYGGETSVLGKTMTVSGREYTIVGVMPAGFRSPLAFVAPQLWVPLVIKTPEIEERGSHYLFVLARLKASHSLATARAELKTIAKSLSQLYPDTNRNRGVGLQTVQELMVAPVRPSLLALLAAVVLVLLVACANIAGLLLIRSTARHNELAVRLALGANRASLFRQFLTESSVLCTAGGVLGILVALWMTDLLVAGLPESLRLITPITVDGPVAAFAVLVSASVSIAFGLLPALQLDAGHLMSNLNEGGTRATASKRRNSVRSVLVVAEIALSLTLTTGALLLIRSYLNLRNADLGFQPNRVLTLSVALPKTTGQYETDPSFDESRARQLFSDVLSRAQSVPGVASVGMVNHLPYTVWNVNGGFTVEDKPWNGERPVTEYLTASPDYFSTMGIRLREGRFFAPSDRAGSAPVAIVNETLARRVWPNERAVGKRIKSDWAGNEWREIVGVVADVHRRSAERAPDWETYVPFTQRPSGSAFVVVRTVSSTEALIPAIRQAISAQGSTLTVADVRTMESRVDDSLDQQRFDALLLTGFAAVAVFLALIGVYGSIAFQVEQRTQEIGVRIALGADQSDISKLVLGTGAKLTALGVGLGLLLAVVTSRLLKSLLFGIGAGDAVGFGVVALLIFLVSLVASYLPARRASRIDPMLALRAD